MPVSFGTFHSIFFSILKAAYNYSASDIITDTKRNELFREIVDELELDVDDTADFISGISGEVSLVKGKISILLIIIQQTVRTMCSAIFFRPIIKKMRQSRLIDFDDMLVFTWELFKMRPDILSAWQKKFQYILIDEFQDINRLQYEIIRMLAAPKIICLLWAMTTSRSIVSGGKAGDYAWFYKGLPGRKTIVLDVNYRCSQSIVESALRVIKNNKERYEKRLRAANEKGEGVSVKMFNDMREEYDTLIKEVYRYHREDGLP